MNQIAAHAMEKRKKKKWTGTTDLQACNLGAPPCFGGTASWQALELGEGSRSATLAPPLAWPLDSIFKAVFCSRQTFGGRDEKKGSRAAGKVQ